MIKPITRRFISHFIDNSKTPLFYKDESLDKHADKSHDFDWIFGLNDYSDSKNYIRTIDHLSHKSKNI
jgi:hypothetical protein